VHNKQTKTFYHIEKQQQQQQDKCKEKKRDTRTTCHKKKTQTHEKKKSVNKKRTIVVFFSIHGKSKRENVACHSNVDLCLSFNFTSSRKTSFLIDHQLIIFDYRLN
jgi:hypothetical protein